MQWPNRGTNKLYDGSNFAHTKWMSQTGKGCEQKSSHMFVACQILSQVHTYGMLNGTTWDGIPVTVADQNYL